MVKKLLILLFFTCSAIVSATNYYVSNSTGNDGLDGRSEANAWKTLSKVNGSTFLPGDVIQFRKGDVWRETLIIPSSGNATNFITFSSFGTGANPRILCSTKAITWTETSSGSHIWKSATTFSGNPFTSFDTEIFFEEPDGTQAWGTYKTGTTGLTAEYHWTYSSGNIYIYSATDPATNYNSVEVPQRESAINMNRKNYLHFDGIDMFYGYHSGYGYNYTHNDMYEQFGLIIENSDIGYIGAWDEALEQGYGIEVVYTDMIVRNNKIHDCGRRSIAMDLYGNGYTARNILVELNEFYNGFHTTGCDIDVGAGYNANLDSVIIRRNYFHENKSRDTDLSNLIFIQNNAVGVCTLSKIYIYSNIFKWQNGYGILMEGAQSVYIYNNTFYEKASLCPSWVACVAVQSNSHATIKNNIFYGGSSSGSVDAIDDSSPYAIHDYNLFYNTTSESETHDVATKNPLFVNAPDDLHINVTSPAIGAGVVIPVVATDFEGITYVEPPNIGAYATPVNNGTPTYLNSVIENANPSLLSMMYNTALGNIVPAASSFTVMVNLVPRAVNSVAISGARVQLTLLSAVSYGDIVTVAYLKPASNPLQNPSGVEAATITAQPVTNNVSPSSPVYVSSVVQNATPTLLEMTYNQALANIIPASSAFIVMVNSVRRNVNSVTISGTKVRLTLASAIAFGNTVTVAYTKPAVNPLQTGTGGLAATITAQPVTNNLTPALPAYVSSVIQNAAPAMLEITFSLSLADIIPDVSAFAVTINSTPVAVTQVSISGTKVRLTLTSPVFMGDLILLSYTKPATMPLQTSTGGQVLTFSGKSVQNNVGQANTPPEINFTKSDTYFSGFVGEIDASGSTDVNGDILSFTWHPPAGIDISSASGSKIQFLAPVIPTIQTFDFGLDVGDGKSTQTQNIPVLVGPFNPGLSQAVITNIDASSYLGTDLPLNISDGDAGTFWSSNGDYQWLICKLRNKFHIDHLNLSFSKGDIGRSYFDVQASNDSIVWDPMLTSSVSCGFSQNFQTFISEGSIRNGYTYLKFIGHGNSLNSLNKISELQVFGNPSSSGDDLFEIGMTIYPNPASEYINIFIDEAPLGPQVIRIINVAGKIEYDRSFDSGINYLQVPVTFPSGLYIIELICYGRILGASKFIVS